MKIPLIPIGNSRGIRIPKTVLEQVGFTEEVELFVGKKNLVLSPVKTAREGWGESFQEMARNGDDKLLDMPASNWDDLEWEW